MSRLTALLSVALLSAPALLAGPVDAEQKSGPVFFRDPDRTTARNIENAIELLARTSVSDHTRGREELEEIGYWAVKPLRKLLEDGGVTERLSAALALGTILDDRAYDDLARAAVNDPHQYVPSFCALMIGRYGRETSLDLLEKLIRDGRKDHRRISAILSVAKIHAPRSWDILLKVVRTEKRDVVRGAAVLCLGFFREYALVRSADGAMPVKPLLKALHSNVSRERRAAVLALAMLGHRDHKRYFLAAADNQREGDPEVRRAALLALGRFPDKDVTALLLRTIASNVVPGSVKVMAAFILKDRKDPTALEKLRGVRVNDNKVKAVLTLALSNFEDEDTVKLLMHRLTDAKDYVRSAAAIGLSRLTTPAHKEEAIRGLTYMLRGRGGTLDPDVRFNMDRARRILREGEAPGAFIGVGNQEFLDDLLKDVEEKLLDLVNLEAEHTLDLSNLPNIKADPRFRVNDEQSNRRDLKDYLELHPYFAPEDVPEPKLVITPKPRLTDEKKKGK